MVKINMYMLAVSKNSLIVYHVLAHLVLAYGIYIGSIENWIIAFVIYLIFATMGGTVTYHRLLSHKSFDSPKWFEYLGTIVASLGGNGSSIGWVAIHREHHRFTDTGKDPHSPHHVSILRIQFASMLDHPKIKYVPDLLRSKFHTWMHKNYWAVNFIYLVAVYSLFGVDGVVFGYFVPTLMVWHAGSAINTVNHLSGYRNYDTKEKSTNNFFTGILVSGEGWHNNHHAHPADAQFGKKWWEFDLGWQLIKLVRK